MDLNLILVIVVIAVALFFSYTNGFHDAANAIATSVSTRAWTPRAALLMAATMNIIGAMMGTAVAKTVGKGIISISDYAESPLQEMQQKGLVIILAALLGACMWNLITWWFGLPSSSSHALIGGMVGAGLMSGTVVHWWGIMSHVVIPMFASPIIGFVIGYIAMKIVLWALHKAQYHRTMRRFRAAAMALGHGIQDAQKTMGIIVMALLAGGFGEHHNILDPVTGEMNVPLWVKVSGALAISLGTMAGGGRIMRTIGRKIIDLDPARGFTAEAVSASILYLCSYVIHAPISTTQVVSTAIMGVGCTKRFSAVRWGVAGNIVIAWFLTLPAAALVSGIVYLVVALPLGLMRGRLVATAALAALLAAPLAACSDSSVMHMQVGQCILLPEDKSATTATTIEKTSCTREHDAEVFALASASDGDFPGAEALNRQAETECISAFDAYVGSDYLTSSLDATWMIPTKDSWVQNDRSIVCLARPLDHSKLTSSVKESGL